MVRWRILLGTAVAALTVAAMGATRVPRRGGAGGHR